MTTKKIVLIVAAVVVVLALLAAVFVAGIVGFTLYQVGNSEAAVKARDFLRNNEQLKADIGEVKDFGSFITGSVHINNNNGEATLKLKVIGERKTVNASVDLVYTKGSAWRVSGASYVDSSGQTIDLLDPYDSQLFIPRLIAWRGLHKRSGTAST
ncbi:MAG TPA: cytochrome c oxidase assembly factor Coa1 family protein [Pyrinomonadaceae bacterium]|nr:cytochrome c oxidase assembly factor Coa1 family protein [Pyrinomonadaceae bacterium]